MPSVSYLIFTATVVFLLVFFLKLNQAKKKSHASDEFWAREEEANFIRKVDPETIDYIKVPLESLPFAENAQGELRELQDTVKSIAQERLLNLTGLTNTDVKFTYGAANFPMVSLCDQRFTQFARTLCQWGEYLASHDEPEKARIVLEYAVSCKTDMSRIYTLLADIYAQAQQPENIAELILTAEKLPTLMKSSIVRGLKEKLASL